LSLRLTGIWPEKNDSFKALINRYFDFDFLDLLEFDLTSLFYFVLMAYVDFAHDFWNKVTIQCYKLPNYWIWHTKLGPFKAIAVFMWENWNKTVFQYHTYFVRNCRPAKWKKCSQTATYKHQHIFFFLCFKRFYNDSIGFVGNINSNKNPSMWSDYLISLFNFY
jgi:hypothetical protein